MAQDANAVVFWDVDHPGALHPSHPLNVQNTGNVLMEFLPPERVFAMSDKPLSTIPHIFNMPAFGHHLVRNLEGPAADIFSRIAGGCFSDDPFGAGRYLPEGSALQAITLRKSSERSAATEAVNNVFLKRGVPSRLASLVAQGADELLMNAIFDAPTRQQGGETVHYRKSTPRTEAFPLSFSEQIRLEIGSCPGYIALSVADQFGSLDKQVVLGFIRKDYQKSQYRVRQGDPGAGLGIYGMLHSGLSLLFISKPGVKTEVVLFFPVIENFKAFRSTFRFFSFLSN